MAIEKNNVIEIVLEAVCNPDKKFNFSYSKKNYNSSRVIFFLLIYKNKKNNNYRIINTGMDILNFLRVSIPSIDLKILQPIIHQTLYLSSNLKNLKRSFYLIENFGT